MKMSELLPESQYEFKQLTREDLTDACEKNITVTGRVEKILTQTQELLVWFGNNIYGKLPFAEVTIYQHQYSKNPNRPLPINICILLGKKIRVKVTEVTEDSILLSRKKNMYEAYEQLKTCTSAMFHVTNMTVCNAFGDIGDGINAKLNVREVSKARIRNIGEVIKKDDVLRVALLNYDATKRFDVSSRQLCKEYDMDDFFEGMTLHCKVNEPVDRAISAFFVMVNPQVCGIIDTTSWMPELCYGDNIEATVAKVTPKGLNLTFRKLLK